MSNIWNAPIQTGWQQIDATRQRLAGEAEVLPAIALSPMGETPASSMGQGFATLLRGVDAQQQAASDRMVAVDSGESDDLVGAMLASQEANLSFSLLMQTRNKVMGAIDELMRMPV